VLLSLYPELQKKVRAYDFAWVERHLGAKLPQQLKQFYVSGDALELEDIIVDEDELYICVAHWHPQNAAGYENLWPGTEGRLILADDGSGNKYLSYPEEEFNRIYFFDHETGEIEMIRADIPTFLEKVRTWKDAD
jgi:hypothetical protein